MKIITISGKAQHGKDTVANIMKEILEEQDNRVLVAHYGDLVKYCITTFLNWDGNKDEFGRYLLQHFGTDIVRAKSPNYWVNFIVDMLTFLNGMWEYVLIPDARYPNEIDRLKESGFDVVTVRVNRSTVNDHMTEEQRAHSSETALDEYKMDYVIQNDGSLSSLRSKVESILEEIGGAYHQMSIDDFEVIGGFIYE